MKTTREGIIVLGTPRSGTTLLRRLLNAHPNIACPGETNLFSACASFVRAESIAGGAEVSTLTGLQFAGSTRENTLARLREFAFQFLRDFATSQDKRRWAEKTAFNAFYIDEIEDICSDEVDYVCVQRHGLDVAVSLNDLSQKNGGYLRELHDYIRLYPALYEAFSHVWVDLTTRIQSFAQAHNAFVVKYEDLVSDPHGTMTELFMHIGEDPADTVNAALADHSSLGLGDWKTYARTEVNDDSVGRWRTLPKSTVAVMAEICNPTLSSCGYEEVKVDAPAGGTRAYELGLLLSGIKRDSR